jgi:5-(carboxyamino)imidazole ribonucleotide synthase
MEMMPIQRVGVIGGGQLAWMMAAAAKKLGIHLAIQTANSNDPAASLADALILAPVADAAATARLVASCDAVTFENEFVDLAALKILESEGACFRPCLAALAPLLDKYQQRCYLQEIGLPVPAFAQFAAGETLTVFPSVLKARRHGYDGQGTFIIDTPATLTAALQSLGNAPVMVEEYVPFAQELAVIAARGATGQVAIYPVVETWQQDRVCHWTIAPVDLPPAIEAQVTEIARHLLSQLQYVGVLGIELFLTKAGQLLINEIAPRTHNSGHYTLDACEMSQFEAQLRAVAGLPLASPNLICRGAVMVNLLGYENSQQDYQEKRDRLAALPQSHLHWYGKTVSYPGRKLGHITVLSHTPEAAERRYELLQVAKAIESIWYDRE